MLWELIRSWNCFLWELNNLHQLWRDSVVASKEWYQLSKLVWLLYNNEVLVDCHMQSRSSKDVSIRTMFRGMGKKIVLGMCFPVTSACFPESSRFYQTMSFCTVAPHAPNRIAYTVKFKSKPCPVCYTACIFFPLYQRTLTLSWLYDPNFLLFSYQRWLTGWEYRSLRARLRWASDRWHTPRGT